jgi:hypothetical protein
MDGEGAMGKIDFRYDATNDIVIAVPHWNIQTAADVVDWYGQYEVYMSRFRRKMDFVVILDDFHIAPAIGVVWGEARGRLHQRFTRFSYRVHANSRVKLFVNTSGVRYNVATQEAATLEDAIEGIKAARLAAELQTRTA